MSTISKPDANPMLAAILTLVILNLGHIVVNGQMRKWLFTLVLMLVPCLGLIIWVLSIMDAYATAVRLKAGEAIPENEYSNPTLFKIMKMIDKTATCAKA